MDIKLRIEQPSDYNETENVTREAFWNHFSPGCDEHYLLHIMRNHPKFVPSILLQNLMARLSAMWSALNHLSWQMTVPNMKY